MPTRILEPLPRKFDFVTFDFLNEVNKYLRSNRGRRSTGRKSGEGEKENKDRMNI